MKSQPRAASKPPPRANPFTAAMAGMGRSSIFEKTFCPFLEKLFPEITKQDIEKALEEFLNRKRNFGK